MLPNLFPNDEHLPRGALDIGSNYILLGPQEFHQIKNFFSFPLQIYASLQNWRIQRGVSFSIHRFARLHLPNGQIA